jgi:ornithine decarboxylase
MTPKLVSYLADNSVMTPCLVVDLEAVGEAYDALRRRLPLADIYYAVKANPAAPVLDLLTARGSFFDAASVPEIAACLDAGADPRAISYGNTIKKAPDIAQAFAAGVRMYAFDSAEELEKLAKHAPGAEVYCRITVPNEGAGWPLSRKFGCEPEMAVDLLARAKELGLVPYGVSFHVGSQQADPEKWEVAIGRAAMVFTDLAHRDIELQMINLGGGYPIRYRDDIPALEDFADSIMRAMTKSFGNNLPRMVIEPGRSIVGAAGVIEAEVVLVSKKSYDDDARWVYLDVGMFGGLAETMDESIQYPIEARRGVVETGPVYLAGPTCDGADILYEKARYELPMDLKAGDKVRILNTGAYTTTYSSVGFNGFDPLGEVYV